MAGIKERLAGRFMQWEGKATGDPIRTTEGKALSALGRLKRALSKLGPRRGGPRPPERGGVQRSR